ncbi:hypothetical protein AA103196_1396 [Ameyamaea chiangmaiensis NBRC 103196]|uniref:Uncharacterized protein n=2 Tax=Ameyamaea chiangmaiensis TaxID=442969 RepID=A0A850PB50_9PROT|nr:hypothetical protein [Ameyamaea chiangmaiensis]NVN41757.1 hypothetical protein [Ameyamaea chiangmaiensis]GBQ66438.1 hypothetical protein AA103196_1396 [Ameyamaea chiangmaiensis NBRC 103196]
MTGEFDLGDTDPADRLENALNRIAYALHRSADQRPVSAPPAPAGPQVDMHALAANIDAVVHRIRTLLDETSPGTEG